MSEETTTALTETTTSSSNEEKSSFWTISKVMIAVVGGFVIFLLLLFILGLLMAFGAPDIWAPRMELFRNIVVIILAVQVSLIIGAIAITVVQIARFVNLLTSEIKPVATDTKEAIANIRTTTEFVGKQSVDPLITIRAFFAGLFAFSRELFAFRRLLKRNPNSTNKQETPTDTES